MNKNKILLATIILLCEISFPKIRHLQISEQKPSKTTQEFPISEIEPISSVARTAPLSSPTFAAPTITPITPSLSPSPTASLIPAKSVSATPHWGGMPTLQPIHRTFITNGDREKPFVAITFDLCQKPEFPAGFDDAIINALLDANAPATFFVGGDWARTHPEETQSLARNPLFELGNHSWSHPDLIDLTADEIQKEISKTQEILFDLTGQQPKLFRLPSGLYNDLVLDVISSQGLYTIQWDVVTADPAPDNTADNINRIVHREVQNGSIIIMHANGRGWHTAEALPSMIEYLREQGFILVRISQLIGLEPLPDLDRFH